MCVCSRVYTRTHTSVYSKMEGWKASRRIRLIRGCWNVMSEVSPKQVKGHYINNGKDLEKQVAFLAFSRPSCASLDTSLPDGRQKENQIRTRQSSQLYTPVTLTQLSSSPVLCVHYLSLFLSLSLSLSLSSPPFLPPKPTRFRILLYGNLY